MTRRIQTGLIIATALALFAETRSAKSVVVTDSPLFTLDTRPFDWPPAQGPFVVLAESHFFVVDTRHLGIGTVAESPLFVINTKGWVRGGLAGRVLGGGLPLQGAHVELVPGTKRVVTGADGRFVLDGVLAGTGYQLRVAATGFESTTVSGVRVTVALTDLGDIRLASLRGELRLAELSPPVNPPVSLVRLNGAAYRYYQVVAGPGRMAGGTVVALRRTDGVVVPQTEVGEHDWAGAVPGVADADGIVRLAVPAWTVGSRVGDTGQFEVLLGGNLAAKFQARIVENQYDLVWRHRVGGGVSGKIKVLRVSGKGAYEAEVRHELAGDVVKRETITRTRQAELRAGVEIGGGVKVVAGTKAKIGASGFLAAQAQKTFHFDDPASTNPDENLVKLYLALGDPLSLAPGPGKGVYDFVRDVIEPPLLGSLLDSAGADLTLGGYAEGELSAGFKAGRQVRVGAIAELSREVAALIGCEERYRVEDEAWSGWKDLKILTLGFVQRGEINIGPGVSTELQKKATGLGIDLLSVSSESAFRASLVRDLNSERDLRIAVEEEATLSGDLPDDPVGWVLYLAPDLANELSLVFNEKLEFDLPESGGFSRVSALAPVWGVLSSSEQAGIVRSDQPAALVTGLVQSALNDGVPLKYERSIYGAKAKAVEPEIDLDAVIAGLGVSIEGAMERGAELVTERGRIWRMRRMGLESAGSFSADLLPSESIFKKETRWALNAAGVIGSLLNELYTRIKEAGETTIEAGGAVLRFGEGVIDRGADVISRWFRAETGGRVGLHGPMPDDGWLPPPGVTNYVYGVSGFFSFRSKGVMSGAAVLSLPFNEAEVAGLNPLELSVYRLVEGTNRWELIGGQVDTNTHTVTVAVTNLGTFALAPPLPTGNLLLVPAGDSMPADGSSVMTFAVTNLVLNTGALATRPWLFTVSVAGGSILDPDIRPETSGVQVGSTNGVLRFNVRAPLGGNRMRVEVASLAGDAWGEYELPLVDEEPPGKPDSLSVVAGQSRLFVTWRANSEPDAAQYRVYYRAGKAGPPWDGTAAVEGRPSPVATASTNIVLRGLSVDTDYYIAVAAIDTTGNEGPVALAAPVSTTQGPPLPPSNVMLRIESDGTAHVAWTVSEDDGFNDRDVVRYEIWRAVLPGGEYAKTGELPAGSEVYLEPAPAVDAAHFVRYGIRAIDSQNLASQLALSNRLMADGRSVDNDGDGMPDEWESRYGLNSADPTDAAADLDGDRVSNLDEYLAGTEPGQLVRPRFESARLSTEGRIELTVRGVPGTGCVLQATRNLLEWADLVTIGPGEGPVLWSEEVGGTGSMRFYRLIVR